MRGGAGLVGLDNLVLEVTYWRVEDKILSRVYFPFLDCSACNSEWAWFPVHSLAGYHCCFAAFKVQVLASRTEIDAEDAAASRSAGTADIFAQVKAAEVSEDLFLKVLLRPYLAHQQAS